MRVLLATLLLAGAPALVLAQTTAPVKPAAKSAAKPAQKPITNPSATPGPRRAARVKAIEEATPVDDDPAVKLTPADLEVAKLVHIGEIPCELGATVHITPHQREGFFVVRTGMQRFRMHPVESRTGAIRLEDPVAGAMWLQLGNKSMLMSQKMGKRLADECMNPTQSAMNENLKKNPLPSLLEPLPVVPPAAVAVPAVTSAEQVPAPGAGQTPEAPASAAPAPAAPASGAAN